MLGLALGLGALIGGLVWATYVKSTLADRVLRWVVGSMEPSAKRVGAFALVPGMAATGWIIYRGIAPPAAVVVGALASLGVFAIALSILKMEGLLTERESAALARLAARRPPPSTKLGRIVWAAIGVTFLGVTFVALHVVSG